MPRSWRWRSSSVPFLMAAGLAIGLAAGPARAQPWQPQAPPSAAGLQRVPDPDAAASRAIDAIIIAQWQALRTSNAAGGFAYASPRLQEMYGSPAAFLAMVRAGYQPVLAARRIDFEDFVTFRGYLTRRVRLLGASGQERDALYLMTRLADGSWRIAGCVLLVAASQS
jgi:Domain of unknown function (DUF4864)